MKIEVTKTQRYCYINAIADGTNERIGKVCIDLDNEDANRYKKVCEHPAKIILVMTSVNECGKGIASSLLNKAIEELPDYTLYLNVIPLRRTYRDKSKNELIKFYEKFGFKRYKEDICTTTMIRI